MRKLSEAETILLSLIKQVGGSWCPTQEERETPQVWMTLRSLERKRRLWVECEDGSPPRYHITSEGAA